MNAGPSCRNYSLPIDMLLKRTCCTLVDRKTGTQHGKHALTVIIRIVIKVIIMVVVGMETEIANVQGSDARIAAAVFQTRQDAFGARGR
jgi:hypothetical protein